MDMNGILIGSEDPARLVAYHTRVLGEPTFRDEGYTTWRLGTGWVAVGAHDQVHGKNAHPGRVIWNIETPDVRGTFERFVAAGATVVREPYNPGGPEGAPEMLIATFADPDDNYFQLVSPMEM